MGSAIVKTPAIAHKDPTNFPHTPTGLFSKQIQVTIKAFTIGFFNLRLKKFPNENV